MVALLCAVVIFLTGSSLKKNADTLERIPMCGMRAHAHSAACYDGQGGLACGMEAHEHTDACYQQRPARKAANSRIDAFIPLNAGVKLTSNDVVVTAEDAVQADTFSDIPAEGDVFSDIPVDDGEVYSDAYEAAAVERGVIGLDEAELEAGDAERAVDGDGGLAIDQLDEVEYLYDMAGGTVVTLSEVLAVTGMGIGIRDVAFAGESLAAGETAEDARIAVEQSDGDFVIVAMRDFDAVELAIGTDDDIHTAMLLNGRAPVEEPADDDTTEETGAQDDGEAADPEALGDDTYIIEETDPETADETTDGETDEETDETADGEAEEEADDETADDETTEETADGETAEDETVDGEADDETTEDETTDDETDDETAGEAGAVRAIESDSVTLVAGEGATLPENGSVAYSEGMDAQALIDQLNAMLAAQAARNAKRTAASNALALSGVRAGSVEGYAVFDISVFDADGAEFSETGDVSVTVRLENAVDMYAGLPAGADITGVDYMLYHLHDGGVEALPVDVAEEGGVIEGVSFSTEGFSPFVLKYVVSYTWVDEAVTIDLDFTEFQAAGEGYREDDAIRLLNDGVAIDIAALLSGADIEDGRGEYRSMSVEVQRAAERLALDALEVLDAEGGLGYEGGRLTVRGDGAILLSDGEGRLAVNEIGRAYV